MTRKQTRTIVRRILLAVGALVVLALLQGLDGTAHAQSGEADLDIVKDGPTGVKDPGDTFDYVITVFNLGPYSATGVVIIDNLPEYPTQDDPGSLPAKIFQSYTLDIDGFTYPYCTFFSDYSGARNVLVCDTSTYGSWAPGTLAVLTITVEVPTYDAGQENVNMARAISEMPDPDVENDPDCDPGLEDANWSCHTTQVSAPQPPAVAAVGGILEPRVEGADSAASLTETDGSSAPPYAAIAGAAAAAAVALTAGAWYARRRLS